MMTFQSQAAHFQFEECVRSLMPELLFHTSIVTWALLSYIHLNSLFSDCLVIKMVIRIHIIDNLLLSELQ
jgi:hypothetical protein